MRTRPLRAQPAPRRPTNVTLPEELLNQARELKINVSQACEVGLADAVRTLKEQQWKAENRQAIDEWNEYFEKNGLPLAEYRQF